LLFIATAKILKSYVESLSDLSVLAGEAVLPLLGSLLLFLFIAHEQVVASLEVLEISISGSRW